MALNPLLGWWRVGLPALAVLAAASVLWWPAAPLAVDVGDLTAQPVPVGREVVATGAWKSTSSSEESYMVVVLRGRNGAGVVCHFEDVPAADRLALERRLMRRDDAAVRGRSAGFADGMAVLRDCHLLD